VQAWQETGQLPKSGQHDRKPVTTRHEKRSHASHLFAMSYGSFLGRRYRKFAPFVRQTGKRKVQTCAKAMFQQLTQVSPSELELPLLAQPQSGARLRLNEPLTPVRHPATMRRLSVREPARKGL